MRPCLMFPTILVFGLSAAAVAAADRAKQANQTAAVRPSSGQELQEQIVLELRAIRQILESTAGREVARDGGPPKTGKVRTAGPGLGSATAPLTLVEFSDLQCPFCRQFATTVFGRLKTEWVVVSRQVVEISRASS